MCNLQVGYARQIVKLLNQSLITIFDSFKDDLKCCKWLILDVVLQFDQATKGHVLSTYFYEKHYSFVTKR